MLLYCYKLETPVYNCGWMEQIVIANQLVYVIYLPIRLFICLQSHLVHISLKVDALLISIISFYEPCFFFRKSQGNQRRQLENQHNVALNEEIFAEQNLLT